MASVTVPVSVNTPSTRASSIDADCVQSRIVRRSYRSTITPPNNDKNSVGNDDAAAVTPTQKAEPVISSTSHPCATICSQVPIIETICPIK